MNLALFELDIPCNDSRYETFEAKIDGKYRISPTHANYFLFKMSKISCILPSNNNKY
jgi:hypothetical protein